MTISTNKRVFFNRFTAQGVVVCLHAIFVKNPYYQINARFAY